MKTFQVYRKDIDKIVCKSIEAQDFEDAAGKYVSVLMISGMVKMTNKVCELIENNLFRITKLDGSFFEVIVKEV